MIDYDGLYAAFFQMIKDMVESITLPTGKNAMPACIYCAIITALAIISQMWLGVSIFSWQGGLIATLLFGALALEEKKGIDEVSRLYRIAKARVKAPKKGPARAGANVKAPRGANARNQSTVQDQSPDSADAP